VTIIQLVKAEGFSIDPLTPARHVLASHIAALNSVADKLDLRLVLIAEQVAACKGQVIFTGVGKSAIAARKISASFSSHSIAATFMHAGDALHGDLGIIRPIDIVFVISASGTTTELVPIVTHARNVGAKTVAITVNVGEIVPSKCDYVIAIPDGEEGCAFGIAPFASTIATIAIGDALTVLAAEKMSFSRSDMAILHPGGHIGRQLAPIGDMMLCGDRLPMVQGDCSTQSAIDEMSAKGLGVTAVVDERRQLLGLITDGDLRRHFGMLEGATAAQIMTPSPLCIHEQLDRHAALTLMRRHRVDILPVVESDGSTLIGMVHLQDILRSGIVVS
jgi:arabinose-5-phosphate isomerase